MQFFNTGSYLENAMEGHEAEGPDVVGKTEQVQLDLVQQSVVGLSANLLLDSRNAARLRNRNSIKWTQSLLNVTKQTNKQLDS